MRANLLLAGRRRAAVAAMLAAVLAAAAPTGDAHAQGGPPSVSVAKPIKKNVVEWTDFIGRFEAVDAVDVRSRVTGYVDAIAMRDGALVKAGDLLFTIDRRTYQAAVAEAEAGLAAAEARQAYAATDLKRAEQLRKTDNIADQVADQRRQAVDVGAAEIRRARATLDRARLDLEFTEIRAPVSGRLSRRGVSPGSLVTANDTVLVNIVSLDPIDFYFDVDERSYLSALRDFDPTRGRGEAGEVAVSLTDGDGSRRGRIDFLDNRLDQATGTMRGRVSLANADLSLVPGLFGRVRLPVTPSYQAVLIPDEAVRADQDRRLVFVVEQDNKLAARPVQLGGRAEGYRIVRAGLTGEETIVVNGLSRAQPGIQIQPKLVELPVARQAASR